MHTLDTGHAVAAIGVGHGMSAVPHEAATEALTAALAGRQPRPGDLVLVIADVDDGRRLLRVVGEAAAPATVVGCSAAGSFGTLDTGLHALSVVHVPAGDLGIGAASIEATDGDLRQAARAAGAQAEGLAGSGGAYAAVVVLSSATADRRDVVRGAYEVAGARVPLVGAAVASSGGRSWHGVGAHPIAEGVTAVWMNSPRPFGMAVGHGWQPLSPPLLVTSAQGSVVHELDGRPALDVYLEERGRPLLDRTAPLSDEAVDLPLGVPAARGGYEVRRIEGRTEAGGLILSGAVHDQALVRVLASDPERLVEGARGAVRGALGRIDRPARGALVFGCTSRSMLVGGGGAAERGAIEEEFGGVQAAGLLAPSQFGRWIGSTGFHDASVAVLAL